MKPNKTKLEISLTPSELRTRMMAQSLIHSTSYDILTVDLSYRSTGVCSATIVGNEIVYQYHCFENPPMDGVGFESLLQVNNHLAYTISKIKNLLLQKNYTVFLIEMPCYTQSAKSAIIIGMLWSAVSQLGAILVEPTALKKWSRSKRGDKKEQVKIRVQERTVLPKDILSNTDVIDAIGLMFYFNDLVREAKHHEKL